MAFGEDFLVDPLSNFLKLSFRLIQWFLQVWKRFLECIMLSLGGLNLRLQVFVLLEHPHELSAGA